VTRAAVGWRRSTSQPPGASRRPGRPRRTACPPRWVLGAVGHPPLVAAGAGEATLNQVGGGRLGPQATAERGRPVTPRRPARRSSNSTAWEADADPAAQVSSAWTRRLPSLWREAAWTWWMHRSARRGGSLAATVADAARQRSQTGRPPAPGSRAARAAPGRPSPGGREPSKGDACSLSSSAARRVTASSVPSWAIRRRAATRSWCSWLLRPANRPLSMRSWRRQVELDWALVPQRPGDLGDRPPGLDQVQDLAAELRRVAASSDAVLLSSASMRNPTTQLHRTGGRPPPMNPGRFTLVVVASRATRVP
jgi:hypothetical protein